MEISELHIRSKFAQYLPNTYSTHYMQPSYRGDYAHASAPKQSAVLLLLVPYNYSFAIVYTQRAENILDAHSGQISFPGGGYSATDGNLLHTALRETYEEIGVEVQPEWIVGALSKYTVPVSNYHVQPFVAIAPHSLSSYTMQHTEIARVIEIPLLHICNPMHIQTKQLQYKNRIVTIPYYAWNDIQIWGVTAMITEELIECIITK